MNTSFKLTLVLSFLLLFATSIYASEKVTKFNFVSEKNLEVGEELTYEVSYSFLKLGQLKFIVTGKKAFKGKTYYNAIAYIDSYNGIPFVDLHMIYASTLTPDFFSAFFRGIVKSKEYTTFTDYTFNYQKSYVRVKKGKMQPYELWTDSTAHIGQEYEDGLSILYYARMNAGSDKSVEVPCFVNEKKGIAKINFYPDVNSVKINAVDYNIACTRLDGELNFVSVFGLTGYFEGWFSDDSASVPIAAKLKVIVGNVRLELTSWKRTGWTPPKYEKN
jgi:hypothetical protein